MKIRLIYHRYLPCTFHTISSSRASTFTKICSLCALKRLKAEILTLKSVKWSKMHKPFFLTKLNLTGNQNTLNYQNFNCTVQDQTKWQKHYLKKCEMTCATVVSWVVLRFCLYLPFLSSKLLIYIGQNW